MTGSTVLHYQLLEKLGAGGMGVVYLAYDSKLERKVALKFLPEFISDNEVKRNQFIREARAAAQLNHPNIATIFNIEEADQIFIVMEYIDGEEFSDKIRRAPLSVKETTSLICQIAEGLQAAHNTGIVHRDIKSGNLMLTTSGKVKILDFGLAFSTDNGQLSSEESISGSLAYMSPEQLKGGDIDHRSDIWSLGIVIYEMLSGKLPFNGEYEQAIEYSILNEDFTPLSRITSNSSPVLEKVINKCLQKNPSDRYQNIQELLNDLNDTVPPLVSDNSARTTKRYISRKKVTAILILAAVLISTAVIFYPQLSYIIEKITGGSDASQQHLLIVPFRNFGGDTSEEFFCAGLVETMTSKLTQLEQFSGSLWVVPSSEVHTNNIKSPGEAKKMFGVNLAVTGALQSLNDFFRLTLNLIDTETLRQLNSSVIDVKKQDVAKLQNLSVIKLIEMLDLKLNPRQHEVIEEGTTLVPDAYEYYLQGRGFLQRFENIENIKSAVRLFSLAISRDSLYSVAYASLAESYWRYYESTKDISWAEKAVDESEKAYLIDSNLVSVNITSGIIHAGLGKNDRAIKFFNKALDIDPMNASAYRGLAQTYEAQNRIDEAERTYKKAIKLRPEYWAGYSLLGSFYYRYGKYEKALDQFKKVIEITPDNSRGYNNLGGIYYFLEDWDNALEMFEKAFSLSKSYSVASNPGTLYFIQGNYKQAAVMYETALEINDKDYIVWGNLASAYYWIRRNERKPN